MLSICCGHPCRDGDCQYEHFIRIPCFQCHVSRRSSRTGSTPFLCPDVGLLLKPVLKVQDGGKREIVITHVDTLDNDWNQLAQTITASSESYLTATDRVYGHFQANSFFEQVAPNQTVALAYSGALPPLPPLQSHLNVG